MDKPTDLAPPPEGVVMQMVMGAWVSKTISDVTRLDVPDLLQKHGPMSAVALTQDHAVDAHPDSLERALRACASVGIFSEDADGRFGPTPLSEVLTLDSEASVKKIAEIFGASWWTVWGGLASALKTGQPQAKNQLGMDYWDYCDANPKEMEDFGAAMRSNSRNSQRGLLEHCDLTDARKVVDIGGGFGHLVIALLHKYPHLRGVVLDRPELIPIAKQNLPDEDRSVASRLEYVGGNMFETVPDADVYIMKHIIHDWDDARCIQLLQHCHTHMTGDGRVISVDAVLPPMGDTSGAPAKFLDIDMLVFIPGKERTKAQWESLYDASGFKITSLTPIQDNFGTSIIEGVKR